MKKTEKLENMMARLDEIVALLESGDADLDESMKLFEEGITLVSGCEKRLEAARQKIKTLTEAENENSAEQ